MSWKIELPNLKQKKIDLDFYKHYIEMLKYHEANRTSTDDRNAYWKNFNVSVKTQNSL